MDLDGKKKREKKAKIKSRSFNPTELSRLTIKTILHKDAMAYVGLLEDNTKR
jgi:hypothetical protein